MGELLRSQKDPARLPSLVLLSMPTPPTPGPYLSSYLLSLVVLYCTPALSPLIHLPQIRSLKKLATHTFWLDHQSAVPSDHLVSAHLSAGVTCPVHVTDFLYGYWDPKVLRDLIQRNKSGSDREYPCTLPMHRNIAPYTVGITHTERKKERGGGGRGFTESGTVRNIGEDIISLLYNLVIERPSSMDKAQAGFRFPATTHT